MATAAQVLGSGNFGFNANANAGLPPTCESYLPLVRQIARQIHRRLPRSVDVNELISAGTLGLLSAVEKFEHTSGVDFGAFARFRVKGAILDALREEDWAPRELRRKARGIQAAIAELERELHEAPSEDQIASRMGVSIGQLRHTLADLHSVQLGSLQEKFGEGEEEVLEYVADPTEVGALSQLLQKEAKSRVKQGVESLPERERLVVTLSFYEELTLKEIGQLLGIGESRVSQLRSTAVLRLRNVLQA